MADKFFVTTPIYYTNGVPHIGHSYSSILADVKARYKRLLGYNVKFSTGVDENSQKVVPKAKKRGLSIPDYLDHMASKHKEVWDGLDITYTDFIRTTEKRHHKFVQKFMKKCFDNGDIYKDSYEGLYCVGCEAFKKKSDLIENENGELICPDHQEAPDKIKENNYFFKLSKYQAELEELFEDKNNFVLPKFRAKEMESFIKGGLEDFSASREGSKFGVEIPWDDDQVAYVWFDALTNYLTVCQDGDQDFWPAEHIIGKDISRFHTVYWPAMLMSAGYQPPKRVTTTGFFTINGQKMSKSLGNVIDPVELSQEYSRDALVFYLLYELRVGSDGDFSMDKFEGNYNKMLLGGWGNLVSRVVNLADKNNITKGALHTSKLDVYEDLFDENNIFLDFIKNGFDKAKFEKQIDHNNFNNFLDKWYELVQKANEYIQTTQPWSKFKESGDVQDGIKDMEFLVALIKDIGLISAGILIKSFEKLKLNLGWDRLNDITTGKDSNLTQKDFEKVFNIKEFDVNLSPVHLYEQK